MALRALLLLALAAVGCAAQAPVESAPVVTGESEATLSADVVESEPCQMVFSPDAALLDVVKAAAARWSQATGCDIHMGEGGIPMRMVARDSADLLNSETGAYQPAVTVMDETGTRIAFAPDWSSRNRRAVIHEMGHALAQRMGHSEDPEALMYWNPTATQITASDLAYICARLDCSVFQPEI